MAKMSRERDRASRKVQMMRLIQRAIKKAAAKARIS
jgi:hypothetical protein